MTEEEKNEFVYFLVAGFNIIDSADMAGVSVLDARNFRRRTEFPSYLEQGLIKVYGDSTHFPERWKRHLKGIDRTINVEQTDVF